MKKFLGFVGIAWLLLQLSACLQVDEPGNLVPKTVDEDASLPAIYVNGVFLHAEAFGPPDSTLVIVLHGGPGSDYRYLLHCKDLADAGYRVVFYDQRGSGLSQRFDADYYLDKREAALDLMYDDLSAVIAYYRTSADQKVFLIGHSWGAMMATAYTGKHPDDIQGLVACEPGGLHWDDVRTYISNEFEFGFWGEQLNDAAYMDAFISTYADAHEVADYKLMLMGSENNITGEHNVAPASSWRAGAIINATFLQIGETYQPDLAEGIEQFHTPVLFFYSSDNMAYPDSWAERITDVYDTVEVIKVNGTGHDGIITDAEKWQTVTMPHILSYFQSR
ncbi:MAG: alpha/beta hydrolase [Chitinophagales bacterium]